MNKPTTQLLAAVADGPCTADELSRRMSYEGLCDRDVCERIRFKETAKLQDVYYAKGDETKALRHYTRSNWREIESAIKRGEFKTPPPKFAEYINKHIAELIDSTQADIDLLQEDIYDEQRKIESYETLQELM